MKIKMTQDLPIASEHGAIKGAEFEVTKVDTVKDLYYFMGKTGSECAAYPSECEVTDESEINVDRLPVHTWEKVNNVTIRENGKSLDKYKCRHCKAKAKMFMLGVMEMDRRFSEYCKGQ